ncbi:MAG: hypothetical protein QXI16_06880 [Sulfolobaceae archaeon]
MKKSALDLANIQGYINTIAKAMKMDIQINNDKLIDITAKVQKLPYGFVESEKLAAIIYMLTEYGLPVKATARILNLNQVRVFKMLKKARIRAIDFVDKFREYLNLKDISINPKENDPFLALVVQNYIEKKDKILLKDNLYGYSTASIRNYRKRMNKVS